MCQKTTNSMLDIVNTAINRYQFITSGYSENETPPHTSEFCTIRLNNRLAYQLNTLADMAYDNGNGELARLIQLQAERVENGLSPMPL
ncbi:hypothetical protein [Photobacterium damselae]|uniref:hypothetical protein n=1 Tax=Photobacterium damselae TaxID=38293 RepID=UPI000D667B7A|nr:hypothetical protein [Photobacterium damselae]AWK83537.1 hypothetical protein BST98_16045 [Photobacterium damselae]